MKSFGFISYYDLILIKNYDSKPNWEIMPWNL